MRPIAVVALGGHALVGGDGRTPEAAARALAPLAERYQLVVTHGNGPQVGALADDHGTPLDVAVAESQGSLGYLIERALRNELGGDIVAVLSEVVVSRRDPAFHHPTKPIGSGARRRLVPSPRPREVLEAPAVRALATRGFTVIAAGGGGIPVARTRGGALAGLEAVVDKDRASALLAREVRASALYLLTDVDGVYAEFGTPRQRKLPRLTAADARALARSGELPAGSMGPKVESALAFLRARPTGTRAVIGGLAGPEEGTLVTLR